MTAPAPPGFLEDDSTQLLWQRADQARQEKQKKQVQQDLISPDAASLDVNNLYGRLENIRLDSATATAGSIASDNTRRQREAAIRAAEIARQQEQAQQDAYNQMNAYAGGFQGQYAVGGGTAGGGAGWGSGGAQGVANVLRAAGFPESLVPTFMAIAKAESSWNPNATHRNTNGTIDEGLFQINSVHKGNAWYPSNRFDPLQSAKAAFGVYQMQGLKAWTVYNSGQYSKFMQAAPPIQPYVANTGANGLMNAQVGQAQSYSGVPTSGSRQQAVNLSMQVLNIPYVWGGNSLATGVDCSGLVQQVYSRMGISMPRQARAQATTGVRVGSYNQLQPGDLVAFKWAGGYAGPNVVSHIAVYAGNGQIIEAYGGSHGRKRALGNSAQDRGAIYIHTRFPGE